MTEDSAMLFAQRYQKLLQLHLSGGSTSESPSPAALELGREAAESGMDALDLVCAHDCAMSDITSPNPDKRPGSADSETPGIAFLLETLSFLLERQAETLQAAYTARDDAGQRLEEAVTRYGELLAESRRNEKQARQFAHQVLGSQEEERREISRDLHDEVAQILAGINVRLATLREGGEINFQSFEASILQTQEMIEESVNVIHRYAKKLRPAILDDLGLIPALRSLIKDLPHPPSLELVLEVVSEAEGLGKGRSAVVYRVAHEALLNVVRHAEAHTATVRLQTIADGIRLEVQDDGKSFDLQSVWDSGDSERLGLIGMKERIEMVGGQFMIESEAGKGTTITADIPFATGLLKDSA